MSLIINRLSKVFPDGYCALSDVTLTVDSGHIIGIIGKSGAGKSTLLRCLNNLEQPSSGNVEIFGQSVNAAVRAGIISTIFQNYNLLRRLTVLDNINLPLVWKRQSNPDLSRQLLENVGLSEKEYAFPVSLSGGQRQRVAIARALVTHPKVLLCDELTSALDPATTLEILQLLKQLNHELGLTMVVISHDLNVVKEICDFVYVLDQGKIVENGQVSQVLAKPQHSITQSFVASLFSNEIPLSLERRLQETGEEAVLRLLFNGQSVEKPVIAELMKTFGVEANIVAGGINHIQAHSFGDLVITLKVTPSLFQSIQSFLHERGVEVNLLGYISDV